MIGAARRGCEYKTVSCMVQTMSTMLHAQWWVLPSMRPSYCVKRPRRGADIGYCIAQSLPTARQKFVVETEQKFRTHRSRVDLCRWVVHSQNP